MKHKKLIFFVATAILSLGIVTPLAVRKSETLEPDNADYGTRLEVDFDNPDIVYDGPIGKRASSESTTKPAVVKIHYHNGDGANLPDPDRGFIGRELWVWCPGVNGFKVDLDSTSTPTDFTVTIDFSQTEFLDFKGKPSLSYIIKYKDTWGGQSENVELLYEEFPADTSGLVEVWAIPGEGNAIEMYPTQALSEMDRFVSGTFEGWKQMSIIATDVPASYKLYALTTNYMKLSEFEQETQLENYLIASGNNPSCTPVTVNGEDCQKFTINLNYTAKVNVQYCLKGVFPNNPDGYIKSKYISFHKLYETSRFETYYNYAGEDLGVTYNGTDSATFKVWAPTAASVRTILYETGTSEDLALPEQGIEGSDRPVGGYDMAFTAGGVWQITIKGHDLNGYYYTYRIQNSLGDNYAIDPYAKACGVNGDRGMIVDWATTNPTNWDQLPVKWDGETSKGLDIKTPNELSICETHIRDLTCDPDGSWTGSEMKGTYSAFIESGTKVPGTSVTSGYDHLVEMGYKAIHLLPVFDHDNNEEYGNRVYNWGYNPKNYNCVEGSYATDPYDGASRVKEFKTMVQKFATNENHTRIIMDVVYNHVASAPASSFNKLMPRYYFRYWSEVWHENDETYTDEHGTHYKYHDVVPDTYCDGSGCGNEVKSEAPMMSKYIVESLCWWAKEYKIKGFRFDLMGLIDWQTIKKAAQELYKIDPDILIYGEGWTGDGDHAHILNWREDLKYYGNWGSDTGTVYSTLYKDGDMCYVATFNDAGRNELKGGNDGNMGNAYGFIDQGSDHVGGKSSVVTDMMIGYHTDKGGNPNQSISYASCHDNYALFDTLVNSVSSENTYEAPEEAIKALVAVESAIMFSNGIALMQGGEELFRSKEVTTAEDIKLMKPSDGHTIKNHLITHNAYNLSDAVSAFKWGRKVSIGSLNTLPYVQEIAKAIHLRNSLPKYDYDYLQAHNPYDGNQVFNAWGNGNGRVIVAVRNGNYFCFIKGKGFGGEPYNDPYNNIAFGDITSSTIAVDVTSRPNQSNKGYWPTDYAPDYQGGTCKGIGMDWYTTVILHK